MEKTRPILYGVADYAQIGVAGVSPATGTTGILPVANGTVTLHRLVLVFHGGDCVLADSV